jgi:uncharacterized protein (TIGR03083 family)
MKRDDFLRCLAADEARLREVATDLTVLVPTCPGWTVDDLVRHVAMVYLHKVECVRTGEEPAQWPPDTSGEAALALLDRAYATLVAEFAARDDADHAGTWYEPDQTVGFWVRRMAQETVIHRVDAEIAAGVPIAPISADLATDGIDEVLVVFLAYETRTWPDDFTGLDGSAGDLSVLVTTGDARWLARLDRGAVAVDVDSAGQAVTQVSGEPSAMLRWLWGRADDSAVQIDGDRAGAARLRALMAEGLQ